MIMRALTVATFYFVFETTFSEGNTKSIDTHFTLFSAMTFPHYSQFNLAMEFKIFTQKKEEFSCASVCA